MIIRVFIFVFIFTVKLNEYYGRYMIKKTLNVFCMFLMLFILTKDFWNYKISEFR